MKRILAVTILAVNVLTLAACGQGLIAEPSAGTTDTQDSEIVNGDVDHGHPSVGKIRMSGQDICTGTLVGKHTVLCAAHCILKPASEYAFVLSGKPYRAESIIVHPGWDRDASNGEGINDLSVIRLEGTPPVAPSAIATKAPSVGENLTLVGFGVTGQVAQDFGTKRTTHNTIGAIASTKIYWLPDNGIGTTCYGDSGGPAFANVGGEEIQVGITSGGQPPCDQGYAWDTRVDLFATWIGSVSKGDVVLQGSGKAPAQIAADTEKPKVHIGSPASNTTISAGEVTVKSTVHDNVGVTRAELWIDGELAATETKEPFAFPVKLGRGTHQLRVYGYDAAGNIGRYTVTVQAK